MRWLISRSSNCLKTLVVSPCFSALVVMYLILPGASDVINADAVVIVLEMDGRYRLGIILRFGRHHNTKRDSLITDNEGPQDPGRCLARTNDSAFYA